MFWKSKEVGEHIAHVASAIEDADEFSRRAQESAAQLGRKAIRKSRSYLWGPPPKPAGLQEKFQAPGEWMSVCQAAIFEIWYHLGDAAVPALRRVAFGLYDWTQANATNALCRLALNGVEADQTADQIAEALSSWRYEQIMGVRDRVAELAAQSESLRRAYDALTEEYLGEDPVDGFELISAAAQFNPDHVRVKYEAVLRRLADGAGLEGRTAYDDGHVVPTEDGQGIVARSGETYPQVEDFHRIRAALVLHQLLPDDREIASRLQGWAAEHPDESVRHELQRVLGAASG